MVDNTLAGAMTTGQKVFLVICVSFGLLIGGCFLFTGGLFMFGVKKAGEIDAAEKKKVADAVQTNDSTGMDVSQFLKEYNANPIAAEEKYKDKVLSLSGVISNIDPTFGQLSVSLSPDAKSFQSVSFFFDDDEKPAIVKLTKGQRITIAGLCKGGSLLTKSKIVN